MCYKELESGQSTTTCALCLVVHIRLLMLFISSLYQHVSSLQAFLPCLNLKSMCCIILCMCRHTKSSKVHAIWERARTGLLLMKTECLRLQRLAVLQVETTVWDNWAVWQCVSKGPFQLLRYVPFQQIQQIVLHQKDKAGMTNELKWIFPLTGQTNPQK